MGKEFKYNIEEFIGTIKDSPKNTAWTKAVLRIQWGDNPTTLDIRQVKMDDDVVIGKGISMSNEEADRLIKILLDKGYGTIDDLEKALTKKKSFFTVTTKEVEGPINIECNL